MKASVLGLDGKEAKQVELPAQFSEGFEPALIGRAVHAEASMRLQPKGSYVIAGRQVTAEYYGRRHAWRQTINTGRSRLPREKLSGGRLGRVLIVPHAVKGRRAHPPKPAKILIEKINSKEKNFAIRSAISASADAEKVKARAHIFEGKTPLVVDDAFEELKRLKDAKKVLAALGLDNDLERAKKGRRIRSGRARLRKGGYKVPKTVLIVYGKDKGVWKATRNIPGVDAVDVRKLSAELLAPGGDAGRLVLWTNHAIEALANEQLFM